MFERQSLLKETPAAQAQRFLALRGRAEAKVKADPKGSEGWVRVLELLEFVEVAGAAFARVDDFVEAARGWLLHEHTRLVESGASLPTPVGTYEQAVRKYGELRKEFAGIAAPSQETLKARADSMVEELTKALNENASLKASSEFLQKRLDTSGIEEMRLKASKADLHAQNATIRADVLAKQCEKKTEELIACQQALKELEANSLDDTDYEGLEERAATLEVENKALKFRMRIMKDVFKEQTWSLIDEMGLMEQRAKRGTKSGS